MSQPPAKTESIVRHEAIPVKSRIAAPMRIASVEVLAHAARDEAEEGVQIRIAHRTRRRELFERRSPRHAVDSEPHLFTRHLRGVGEEDEGARQQRGVEYVHARTAEDLLAEDHGEGRTQRDHPQRRPHGHHHRDQQARNEEALVDFVAARLREGELDAQTHDVRHDDHRQHLQESEPESLPARHAHLITRVVHAEQQGRKQRDDHDDHRALHVVAVTDVRTLLRRGVRYEKERLERIEGRCEEREFAAFGEGRLQLVY